MLFFYFLCSILQTIVCSFVPFLFGHCIVCPSSIYSFRLPLWYLSIHFRIKDSDYQIGIFKYFLKSSSSRFNTQIKQYLFRVPCPRFYWLFNKKNPAFEILFCCILSLSLYRTVALMFFVTINATGYASAAFSLSQDKTTLFRIIPSLSRQNHKVRDYCL